VQLECEQSVVHQLLTKIPQNLPLEEIIAQSVQLERRYPATRIVQLLGVDLSKTNVAQVQFPFSWMQDNSRRRMFTPQLLIPVLVGAVAICAYFYLK
jgi:hypothetical protein